MKTRTNKRSIKNRRNTKKFRGGMDSANPPPYPGDIALDTAVTCPPDKLQEMKDAKKAREKGSNTRSSSVQQQMKLIENKQGRFKASEFKCIFHKDNDWKMPNGRASGFLKIDDNTNCPECEACIKSSGANPPELSGDGSKESSTEEIGDSGITSSSSAESNCGESAKKALKLFNSLQNGEIDANAVEACIKSPHAQAEPVSVAVGEDGNPIVAPAPAEPVSVAVGADGNPIESPAPVAVGGKRKKSKSKRTRRRGRKTKRTRRRSRKTKRNKRKLKKRNSRKQ